MRVNETDNGTMAAGEVGAWSMSCATWPHLQFIFNTLESSFKAALMWLDILHRFPCSNPMMHTHFSYVTFSRILGLLVGAMLCLVEDSGFQGVQARRVTFVMVFLERHNPFSVLLNCMRSNSLNSPINLLNLTLPVSPVQHSIDVCPTLYSLGNMTILRQRMGCRRGGVCGRPLHHASSSSADTFPSSSSESHPAPTQGRGRGRWQWVAISNPYHTHEHSACFQIPYTLSNHSFISTITI